MFARQGDMIIMMVIFCNDHHQNGTQVVEFCALDISSLPSIRRTRDARRLLTLFKFIFPDNDDDHDKHHHHRCVNKDGLIIRRTCNLEDDDSGEMMI